MIVIAAVVVGSSSSNSSSNNNNNNNNNDDNNNLDYEYIPEYCLFNFSVPTSSSNSCSSLSLLA